MEQNIHNPHDKFVKDVFADKERAIAFFEQFLPEEILAIIDLRTLEYQPNSYITSELSEIFSDMLFKIHEKGVEGEQKYISILYFYGFSQRKTNLCITAILTFI